MEDLDWLGLDWDEGPGGTYPYGSAVQSERLSLYHECVERWKQEGKVYRATALVPEFIRFHQHRIAEKRCRCMTDTVEI